MTSSHQYCSHDDDDFQFQSIVITTRSTLKQHLTCCADCQSSLSFPWWLPVITTNAVWGIPCKQPISMQWLAVTTFMLTESHRVPRSCTNKKFHPPVPIRQPRPSKAWRWPLQQVLTIIPLLTFTPKLWFSKRFTGCLRLLLNSHLHSQHSVRHLSSVNLLHSSQSRAGHTLCLQVLLLSPTPSSVRTDWWRQELAVCSTHACECRRWLEVASLH